ncbi:MAG: UDP-N-acetylmuramoyl-tripeptide--D-alanyl-D-alanine ligase [Oscillospiraceae bacterium]|nr:UDP-N-acetylmuramoyl-tripeptide--D-alanyl-D-alanine ligase [Oscillospiraceae bacterium]
MRATTLKEIAQWCGGTVNPDFATVQVTSLCHDSREALPGTLFFALEGQTDGHRFVSAAKEQGAEAAVVSRALDMDFPLVIVQDTRKALVDIASHYRDTMTCTTIAITGSVGKTTTRAMTMQILGGRYKTSGTIKNYNNDIGLPITIGKSAADCEMLVLEMGMNHFGELRKLSAIGKPDLAVITNIGSMHIENLGSREGILQAKLEILEGLKPDGLALFNGDEPMLWNLRGKQDCKKLYFGIENSAADICAENIETTDRGSSFTVRGLGKEFSVEVPVSGKHNVYNALAAVSVAMLCEVPEDVIRVRLAAFENAEQRQVIYEKKGFVIIDDTYNAGPESVTAALNVLENTHGLRDGCRHIAVLGDMLELGNHSSAEHHKIGRIAAYKADLLFTYGPDSEKTVCGAITGGMAQRSAIHFSDQAELVNTLKSRAKPGDVLLFKGSHGMHMEQALKMFLED